jgi:hypothetical protein
MISTHLQLGIWGPSEVRTSLKKQAKYGGLCRDGRSLGPFNDISKSSSYFPGNI